MPGSIDACREAALAVLQPTKAELDRGLALHAESLVFDSYGFAPRAAADGAALARAIEAGASELELQDLREDMSMTRWATVETEGQEFARAWEASGVTCIFQNAGEEGQSVPQVLKRLARFTYATDRGRDLCSHAAFPEDVEAAKAAGRHCLYFTANGVPLTEHWTNVTEELRYIRIFYQLGIRMMHLTYNRRNMIGDGCAEPANAGLSDFGREVIAEMNRVGVIADCAHSGWQTSLEAARASTRPMVASHSGCAALNVHHRCKPDEVIRAICDTGGFIGVCCVPAFLGGSGDLNALLDHVAHVARTFGPDHVTIGTDTAYSSANEPGEMGQVRFPRSRPRWNNFWQPDDALFDPVWREPRMHQSLAWTNWPLYTVGLVQRGFSDEDIRKIIGGNVLRVTMAVLTDR